MVLYNFKAYAWEKDTCDMPLSSPSGLLKKQLDSAVIEEANKEVSKLITSTGGKQSYTSSESYHCKACSITFVSNFSCRFCIWQGYDASHYSHACMCMLD